MDKRNNADQNPPVTLWVIVHKCPVPGGLARGLAPTTVRPDITDERRYEIARRHMATISMPVSISRNRG
tara:strand:- start:27 stop:233 length:207 start_codon:yes stop_codon:yes gene_type:complete